MASPVTRAAFRFCGVLLLVAWTTMAHAVDPVVFDPDGGGPAAPVAVGSFDWDVGNALGVSAIPFLPAPGSAHTFLAQAALSRLVDPSSQTILGTGLNAAFEITIVGGYGQIGTDVGSGTATLVFDPANVTNFVRVYWDPALNSNALTGTGYDDGVLILTGTVQTASGVFTNFGLGPVALDQFGANNYPAISTITGSGGAVVAINVDTFNAAFFPDRPPQTLFFNTSLALPFLQTNPSAQFADMAGAAVAPLLGAVNGSSGPDLQLQADANSSVILAQEQPGECRMTGGGVTEDGAIPLDANGEVALLAEAQDGNNRYTFGGQIGAPTASQPEPSGEWTHHQFKGPDGDFVFRVGTHSAPPQTRVLSVTCSDPGFCHPARPAPFKQLDFTGVGSFRNVRGHLNAVVVPDNKPNFTLHYVEVHFEDIGEPGPGGKQPKSDACTHVIGTPIAPEDCTNCADVYQITIHATADPASPVIYAVGGFIDNGNIQLHPAIK